MITPGDDYPVVQKVQGLQDIVTVDCAPSTCYALNSSGDLYSFDMDWTTRSPKTAELYSKANMVKYENKGTTITILFPEQKEPAEKP